MKRKIATHGAAGSVMSKISIRLLLSICLIVLITGICSISVINWRMKMHAREEAREKAMILLNRNLATHTYFSHQLKPTLFKKMKPLVADNYFEPVWMSSTYAVREIDQYYQSIAGSDYYYKECAINARSPENEADGLELSFIQKLNSTSEVDEYSGVRTIDGKPFFVVLRRGEAMEQSCLRCHSTPEAAPADMVSHYGPLRSFHRSLGEVVSAVSIRIPLGAAYSKINRLVIHLSILFGIALLIAFGMTVYLGRRWMFDPLRTIRSKTMEISKNPNLLGEQIAIPSSYELSELTKAFNAMSSQLRKERDQLENRVRERTLDLDQMNTRLKKESDERQKTILELQTALNEITTLRGILPICSFCKKIRDDTGYWNKIEAYISDHSDADFSHSVCPECAKEHYPDFDLYDDQS